MMDTNKSKQYSASNITDLTCSSTTTENNWAFIDMQNLFKGIQERDWKIIWKHFRKYLADNLNVTKAVVFMGRLKEYEWFYKLINDAGFEIEFRDVKRSDSGKILGGNVDVDLASFVMDYKHDYDKAIIIADDGDYCRTIKSLNRQNKLKLIISSHLIKQSSKLIRDAVPADLIITIHSLRNQIEYKKLVA